MISREKYIKAAVLLASLLVLLSIERCSKQDGSNLGQSLPDFSAIDDVPTLKTRFYSFLRPMAIASNEVVREKRAELLELKQRLDEGKSLKKSQQKFAEQLAADYDVDASELSAEALVNELLHRVDTLPTPLMLVQAATESGWGRSRFAQEGNNLYGQWCYSKGCGLVPESRSEDADHEVRRFDSPIDSVASYLHNINTNPAYEALRSRRYQLRQADQAVTGYALAETLIFYSERREEYVDDIKTMLRQYHQLMDNNAS